MTPLRSTLVEALGFVLAPALFFRAFCHVMTAAVLDHDPALCDGTDVRLASPVPALRGTSAELTARLMSTTLALFFAFGFDHVAWAGLAGTWLTINWIVLLSDPVTAVYRLRPTTTDRRHTS